MKTFLNLGIVFFTLAVILFCYLAFSFVRWIAWTILWHWMDIAVILVLAAFLYLWRSWSRD